MAIKLKLPFNFVYLGSNLDFTSVDRIDKHGGKGGKGFEIGPSSKFLKNTLTKMQLNTK